MQQLEPLYETSPELFQRSKHFIMWLIMVSQYSILQRYFLFPFTLANHSPFLSLLLYTILSLFPSVSSLLVSQFLIFQPSFGLDNSHLYFSIPLTSPLFPSKANTQICCFCGIVSSISLWHHTRNVRCLFSLLPTIFLHSSFYLAGYIYLVRKMSP